MATDRRRTVSGDNAERTPRFVSAWPSNSYADKIHVKCEYLPTVRDSHSRGNILVKAGHPGFLAFYDQI